MKKEQYPSLSFLKSKSNIKINTEDSDDEIELNSTQIARNVWEYYNNKRGPKPLNYIIKDGDDEYEIKSTLGVKKENFNADYEKIQLQNKNFSQYDEDLINSIGIDTNENWNGRVADITPEDNKWTVRKTDYYSTYPIVKMLSMEVVGAGSNSLRDYLFNKVSDFESPKRPILSSCSGVMIANKGNDELVIIMGRRSEDANMNSDMLSIFPSGKCEYSDLKDGIEKTIEREFKEEIFSDKTKGRMFYKKHIETEHIITGWNLRTGGLNFGHALFIDSRVSYDVLNEISEHNEEIQDIIEIPINDVSMISDLFNFRNMSGYAVSIILETLIKIDRSDKYPDLNYKIKRK
jgi:hypothetical protein